VELGLKFEHGNGRYRRVPHSGGMIVNVGKQRFFNATAGTNGDVVELVRIVKGWEFKTAAEWLARRANVEMPNWGRMSDDAIKSFRFKVNVFEIAHSLFQEWLWEDPAALEYVRGRGFSDDVIKEAEYGFSGRRTDKQLSEMKKQFDLFGIKHDAPVAVTILGYKGNVAKWADLWGVDRKSKDWDSKWEDNGRLHGMMITPGIVYAHRWAGQVNYLSRRQLPGFEFGDDKKGKSFNPQRVLVGGREPYFNYVYKGDDENCVIVEGPADADSWGVWGHSAVALCGVNADDEGMASLKSRLKRHKKLYIGLDTDEAGMAKREKVAAFFGPMSRILDYECVNPSEVIEDVIEDEASNE
jgi:hypothetical protein